MMMIAVPLMIWSALTEIDSHACSHDTAMPVRIAARTPISSAGVAPKMPLGCTSGMASSTIIATMNPTKAEASIRPSMPMLTMPLRSHMTPQNAPSASGVAEEQRSRCEVRRKDLIE